MAVLLEKNCAMLVHFYKPVSPSEIKTALEGHDTVAKIQSMQTAIKMLLSGEQLPAFFITVVRYVLPSEDHTIQKLLLLYLEIIEKTDSQEKLLPEMILICQNLRNNLQHPNEFLRGATLRFLCRIKEEEILEPLIPSILACLEHRNSTVRKNAVLAINSLVKLNKGEHLLQDASELIEKVLLTEQDLTTKRNAFLMLCQHSQEKAITYLLSQLDSVAMWGDILQMAVLELIRKVCRSSPVEKGKFIKVVLALLQSTSTAVVYECAVTLVSLSQAPTAIRAAANCYTQQLVTQSDNNVKLIILDRLEELKAKHPDIMQELLMDMLRVLATPDMDIRRKTLGIALDLTTAHNIEEVVAVLKKDVIKSQSRDVDKGDEYRHILVQAIHTCAIKFPTVAANVVLLLMDFLGDFNTASALDVVFFVREIMETNTELRGIILLRLMESFKEIRSSRVINSSLGALPFHVQTSCQETGEAAQPKGHEYAAKVRPVVLADGSYATQTAAAEAGNVVQAAQLVCNLRTLLVSGDYFLGAVLAAALTKLDLRLRAMPNSKHSHKDTAACMMIISGIMELGTARQASHPIDGDSEDRMANCLKVLASQSSGLTALQHVWLESCRHSFSGLIADKSSRSAAETKKEVKVAVGPDEHITFNHLRKGHKGYQLDLMDEAASDLQLATGHAQLASSDIPSLTRTLQLSGLSDPVYAETSVTVHQFDIVMDVTVINRTQHTLQNLCLELATMGDLKLVERPHNYTLGPSASRTIRANIKVSSTETGAIFGNIVYEDTGSSGRSVVVLNDVHIDIMDYISPANCPDIQFRSMWAEFEWENKVAVNTSISNINDFLDHIVASTNMRCLTPPIALDGDCGFLAANLYAKSAFGEDALVNVSIEKARNGKLTGNIRIRSKTQGIALSLGDKLILKQKG